MTPLLSLFRVVGCPLIAESIKNGSSKRMKALERFFKGDMHGVHYALSIFLATAVLWLLFHKLAKANRFGQSARWLPPMIR